ncbi:MAG: transglycosylase SLT domain-containing protein [Sphingomicrobium sp.]
MNRASLLVLALASASPALAQQDPLAPLSTTQPRSDQPVAAQPPAATKAPVQGQPAAAAPIRVAPQPLPAPPVQPIYVPKDWRGVLDAIDGGNWASAQAGIATLPPNILTPVAKAELYTARNSPPVSLPAIQALLAEAPDLPQAEQLARMALKRGAIQPPLYVARRNVVNLGTAPTRYRAKPVQGDPVADQLRTALEPLVKANDALGAEALLLQSGPYMTYDARAEAGQRVAWIYYINGDDLNAKRVADTWRPGATGEWASQASWISGLAAWRLNNFEAASLAFRETAGTAVQRELKAGAYYWAARAEQACRRPRSVAPLLKQAAVSAESFYGLLARETLGLDTRLPPEPHNFAAAVQGLPNVQRAVELIRIGERQRADEMIRHQAAIGDVRQHHGLIEFAKRLELASAQYWLANNGQPGAVVDPSDRYPNPRWAPINGWRVDPALAYGHIVQESTFQLNAVSTAGAVGLMQVVPGTASDMARERGLAYSRATLTDPKFNLEYGQSFIEKMRRSSMTGGQLPKVIASYNAGPTPLSRWASINDKGDPLLWIESLSYWETRYYVPAVLRNMWVYQGLNHTETPTLKAMAQHQWPAFPVGQTRLSH